MGLALKEAGSRAPASPRRRAMGPMPHAHAMGRRGQDSHAMGASERRKKEKEKEKGKWKRGKKEGKNGTREGKRGQPLPGGR